MEVGIGTTFFPLMEYLGNVGVIMSKDAQDKFTVALTEIIPYCRTQVLT